MRRLLLASLCGVMLALASSLCDGQAQALYPEIMGCEDGCAVAAAGWPLPYLTDYPGISVVGSASLTGVLTGEDHFRLSSFLVTTLFWTFAALLTARAGRAAAKWRFRG
ncbi:hypothetical protein [Sphingobium bisphenolivorans]|uniref:hypothetical protein n=1 Tax=Sphingobium bisphenolivorans TaxID=1335760 RepID=UPI00126A311E|nr:hypothetical protein [Sphingobium bisphenolivorans]